MDYATAAFALNLIYFFLALFAGWAVLRGLDRLSGMTFSENFKEMRDDNNLAVAVYLGLRFVGVCYLASAFLR